MGFYLPSGVVNTDSVIFVADTTLKLGPLVKQISDQTLVMINYAQLTPPLVLSGSNFTVDVSSNPQLVVSYPKIDSTGSTLSFLLSGGIEGQQYNISVTVTSGGNPHTDVLTVNIPSSADCDCGSINPVPSLYTQLPNGLNGYINTAIRYFWGTQPPARPGVMDQWYSTDTNTLYEWATDGVEVFWQAIMSADLVEEAPASSLLYSRYNNHWVADIIQTEAPQDAQQYARYMGNWQVIPASLSEAPNDGNYYARRNRSWTSIPAGNYLTDAPANSKLYGRMNGAWFEAYPAGNPNDYVSANYVAGVLTSYMPLAGGIFTGGVTFTTATFPIAGNVLIGGSTTGYILSATSNGTLAWGPPSPAEAPNDGVSYARKNGAWTPTASGAGVADAPPDSTTYARKNAAWVHLTHTDITDWTAALTAALGPYAPTSSVPLASSTFPLMDGTNAIGVGTTFARADHVHPSDTSKYNASNPAGYQTAAQVTAALAPYALISVVPVGSNVAPLINGTAAPGGSVAYSRADHIHPTDTTRLALTGGTMTGMITLSGNPVGNLDAVPRQYVDNATANAFIDCGTY